MISIAMATYNGEKYIKEQIDSILNQTIQDFEIVICDDCSKDETFRILQEYAQNDKRFRIYQNENNLGFKKNFEKAITLCKGEYIALSDQDDIWLPNHLSVLINVLGNKFLACGNAILINSKGEHAGKLLAYQESLDWVPNNDIKKAMSIMLFRNPYQGAAMLFRKELVTIACPIPSTTGYHDKWLAMVACMTGGMNYSFTPILKYRRTPKSVTDMRIKRKSKIDSLRYRIIYDDRIGMAQSIIEKIPMIGTSERSFLDNMIKICGRNSNPKGRWQNLLFFLRHYKTIYSCDYMHWI